MFLPKKVSWILLTLYFIFDNVVSYWAVTKMGGHEVDLLIAPFVETYPLLYFLCIPAEVLLAYCFLVILREALVRALKQTAAEKKVMIERIILTSLVIFWPIANSSLNLAFLLGFRHLGYLWGPITAVGFSVALIYGLSSLHLVNRKSRLTKQPLPF